MILVIGEQHDGVLNSTSLEALAGAQQLSSVAGGMPIEAALLGPGCAEAAGQLAQAAVGEIVTVEHPALAAYTPDAYTLALEQVVTALAPAYVVLPHTYQTRDFAPKLAARLDRSLVADVVAVKGSDRGPLFTRLLFQGKIAADVEPTAASPCFVTLQAGAFRADAVVRREVAAPVRPRPVSIESAAVRQRPEPPFREAKQAVDLSKAERIVAVGRGLGKPDNLPLAERLAALLGAEIGASRPICDAGWLPLERQVGSSGQTVAPALYVALGISGAIQHAVGIKGAKTIVAINKDADAPIFEIADYGIVGDLFEIVPALTRELEK
jgi:electron transfer flavoprotein alpha subunit